MRNVSPHRRRLVWFIILAVLTTIFAIGGVELGQITAISGIGFVMLIFGLPLGIIGLGIVGFSLANERR